MTVEVNLTLIHMPFDCCNESVHALTSKYDSTLMAAPFTLKVFLHEI